MKHTSIFKGIGIIQNAVVAQARVFTSFYHFCYAFSGQNCNTTTLNIM